MKIVKELEKELLNKEMTILELDNTVQEVMRGTNSIFDYKDEIKQYGSVSYVNCDKDIIIEYETKISDDEIEKIKTSEEDEDNEKFLNMQLKVISIWEF